MKTERSFFPAVLLAVLLSAAMPARGTEKVDQFMQLALDCVHREYPNKIVHILDSDDDVAALSCRKFHQTARQTG